MMQMYTNMYEYVCMYIVCIIVMNIYEYICVCLRAYKWNWIRQHHCAGPRDMYTYIYISTHPASWRWMHGMYKCVRIYVCIKQESLASVMLALVICMHIHMCTHPATLWWWDINAHVYMYMLRIRRASTIVAVVSQRWVCIHSYECICMCIYWKYSTHHNHAGRALAVAVVS